MTLTEFLLARIAEDEDAAKETWPHDWMADGNTVTSRDPDPRESHLGDRTQVARLSMTVGKYQREAANAEHIARHDPARVLAECEAKRRIVEWHQAEVRDTRPQFADRPDRCTVCTETGDYDLPMLVWPCPTIKALALPYANHPDYDEAWRS